MKISFKSLIGLGLFVLGLLFVSNYNNSFTNIKKVYAAAGDLCTTDSGAKGILDSNGVCQASFTITTSGSNGAFKPKSLNVTSGSTATFTLTPDPGYYLSSVAPSANGCGSGTLAGTKYRTGSILSDCTITASFKIDYPKITSFTSDNNGAPVAKNTVVKLSWSATGATSCSLKGPKMNLTNLSVNNISNPRKTNPLLANSTFTLTCTNGNNISSSNTTQACFTGLWDFGNSNYKYSDGGRVGYYTNNSNLAIIKTDIYKGDLAVINYIKGTSLTTTDVSSVSCNNPGVNVSCDPIANCCYKNTSGVFVPGPPCS